MVHLYLYVNCKLRFYELCTQCVAVMYGAHWPCKHVVLDLKFFYILFYFPILMSLVGDNPNSTLALSSKYFEVVQVQSR